MEPDVEILHLCQDHQVWGDLHGLVLGRMKGAVLLELLLPAELTLSSLGGFPGWILLLQP